MKTLFVIAILALMLSSRSGAEPNVPSLNVPSLHKTNRDQADKVLGAGKDTTSGRYRAYPGHPWGVAAIFSAATFTGVMFQTPPEAWQGKRLVEVGETLGFKPPEWKIISDEINPRPAMTNATVVFENSKGEKWKIRASERQGRWLGFNVDSPEYKPTPIN